MKNTMIRSVLYSSLAVLAVGCANTGTSGGAGSDEITSRQLADKERQLEKRERALEKREARASSDQPITVAGTDSLLPPNAKVGECYARVWVDASYENETLQVKVRDESEQIRSIPAEYRWVEKEVLVKEASTRLETVPAQYGTETERLLIREASDIWRTDLGASAPLANQKLLDAAKTGGINLASATPGMCFHEHVLPAKYETITEDVLIEEASTRVETTAAQYEWVEERVLVSEASTRIEEVPAVFRTETEQVLDKPAHTIWKKGTGPIQRIDEATGEIMCLVEVPATYKTVSKQVLVSPATTRTVDIPAEYEMVKVRKLVAPAGEQVIEIPAKYTQVSREQKTEDAQFVWHEVHDGSLSKDTRTGAKICLVNEPAEYKTVSRKVVVSPETTREVTVPAQYDTIKVRELVKAASEERTVIPASFKTVTQRKLVADGHMAWRSILCETNMTRDRIGQIQQALTEKGYAPGPVDGVIGKQTIAAVNAFQRDNELPVDRYLNIETVEALGVSPR